MDQRREISEGGGERERGREKKATCGNHVFKEARRFHINYFIF